MLDPVTPESVGLSSSRLERVTSWLQDQVSRERLAGAGVVIGRRGRLALFETAGYADAEERVPFEKGTIVRLYSMTKPVTTVAAMMLYEQGSFQLDDPIARYLPEFSDIRVWAGGNAAIDDTAAPESPITVRQIMTHTAGLTYGFMQSNPVDAEYRARGIDFAGGDGDLREQVERLAEIPLVCQPGRAWNYSVSTDVLGRLVEVWSGESLQSFFRSQILEPLGMVDTGFHVAPRHRDRFATLYAPLSGGDLSNVASQAASPLHLPERGGLRAQESRTASRFLEPATVFSGGGGLTGTTSDYARFCQMLLGGGELDGVRLLGPKTVQYMRLNHLPENRDMAAMGQPVWSETSYEGIGFGLGFAVVIDPVKAQILTSPGEHHWGGAASTFFWIDPREDLYVVFLTQLIPSSTYPIRRELRTRVYQALLD